MKCNEKTCKYWGSDLSATQPRSKVYHSAQWPLKTSPNSHKMLAISSSVSPQAIFAMKMVSLTILMVIGHVKVTLGFDNNGGSGGWLPLSTVWCCGHGGLHQHHCSGTTGRSVDLENFGVTMGKANSCISFGCMTKWSVCNLKGI